MTINEAIVRNECGMITRDVMKNTIVLFAPFYEWDTCTYSSSSRLQGQVGIIDVCIVIKSTNVG